MGRNGKTSWALGLSIKSSLRNLLFGVGFHQFCWREGWPQLMAAMQDLDESPIPLGDFFDLNGGPSNQTPTS